MYIRALKIVGILTLLTMASPSVARGAKDRETQIVMGTYSVPMKEESLRKYAEFPVKYKVRYRSGRAPKISYDLPLLITGQKNDVDLSPVPAEPGLWRGQNSAGNCKQVGKNFQCQIQYDDLILDELLAKRLIQESFPNDLDQQIARERVLAAFGSEGIGIIVLPAVIRESGQ